MTTSTTGLFQHLVEAQRARSSLFRFAQAARRQPAARRDNAALAGPSMRDLAPALALEQAAIARRG